MTCKSSLEFCCLNLCFLTDVAALTEVYDSECLRIASLHTLT